MQDGLVFNIQRYSLQDGPGIRTTVFLKGCPLRCWWCHNPESQAAEPEIAWLAGRCTRCGECRRACPQGDQGTAARCTRCGACVAACPSGARQQVGRRMSVAEVMAEVLRDRIFYEESRGGVTFSGGEPLMQPRFLRELLAECRGQGLHTAVDTAGYAPAAELLALAPLVDLFLYDLKSLDDERHCEATGVSNEPILANLEALGEIHPAIWVRVPVVPGFNDEPGQLETIARHAASIPGVRKLCLLPYHALGEHKAARLRPTLPGDETRHEVPRRPDDEPLSRESLEEIAGMLHVFGLEVQIGG